MLGSQVLRSFLQGKIWPHFDACFVDPEVHNAAAIKTYQKAGFDVVQERGGSVWMVERKDP
ncbi:MAG TPA: hypothetical protein VLG71_02005 [Candidatus Limnocylindria bacterium]|nr:hypothetical protein [Candidatus Limnocylindria bacterium]